MGTSSRSPSGIPGCRCRACAPAPRRTPPSFRNCRWRSPSWPAAPAVARWFPRPRPGRRSPSAASASAALRRSLSTTAPARTAARTCPPVRRNSAASCPAACAGQAQRLPVLVRFGDFARRFAQQVHQLRRRLSDGRRRSSRRAGRPPARPASTAPGGSRSGSGPWPGSPAAPPPTALPAPAAAAAAAGSGPPPAAAILGLTP